MKKAETAGASEKKPGRNERRQAKVLKKRLKRQQRPERGARKRAAPPLFADDNLFNRTSGRVHGYSSHVTRFMRLSISLRTSWGYTVLLFRLLLPLSLLLIGLYTYLQAPNYLAQKREALELLPSPETAGVEAVLLSAGQEPDGLILYEGWGLYFEETPFQVRLQYTQPYGDGTVQLLFSLREDWRVLRALLIGLVAMLAFASFSFLTRGKDLNDRLLRPIADITETAQQMNEKNLSARINVAGTQNELRDLAVVINEMLDRIEAAYNRQKQFVSDASHELRTPIAVIQGYAGLLERWGKDNPDVRDEAIAAITSETQSMKELVENLLFLARHDKKTLSLSFEPFDSADMLHELIKETEIIAGERNIMAGDIAACTLVADRSTVKQAVRVFVDNAVKYTKPGGTVTVSSEKEDDAIRITVSDDGPGIKRADLERIFDRFYRSDEARSGQTGGHGLGLAIARIIAASHGGRIHVKSQVGKGSAFTLDLPLTAHKSA